MTAETLGYIGSCMDKLEIPYDYMQWKDILSFPFFIGEYTDTEPMNEDGMEQGTFILTGTSDSNYLELESYKQKIKEYFPFEGRTATLDSGSVVAVSYSGAFPVPTGDDDYCRIQINLNVQEWRVEE